MGFRPRSDVVFLTDHSTDLSVLQPKSPHIWILWPAHS